GNYRRRRRNSGSGEVGQLALDEYATVGTGAPWWNTDTGIQADVQRQVQVVQNLSRGVSDLGGQTRDRAADSVQDRRDHLSGEDLAVQ
ncbi:hypothetical protein CRN61_01690, partial [Vibrio vulnificus]